MVAISFLCLLSLCWSSKFLKHPYSQCFELCVLSIACLLFVSILFLFSPVFSSDTFVSLFWLSFCVPFYVLGRCAMPPSLGWLALYICCPVGSHCAVPLVTWARSIPCVGCVPSSCSWALIAVGMGLTLMLTAERIGQDQSMRYSVGVDPWSRNYPSGPHFEKATCGANWVVFCCGPKLATRCVGSGASWWGVGRFPCRPR